MTLSTPMLVMFGIYILAMLGIGFAAYRYTNNLSDYILGGRSLGSFVTALSAGASDMSGWLLMGLPGALYFSGLSEGWIAVGLILGAYGNWKLVAGRLRAYTERSGNALTLPDFFYNRFEDKERILRVFSAAVILVFFAIYSASGIVAGARLFESLFGIDYHVALFAGAAATITYTLVGGFLAVSWTDTVQASLMIVALLITPVAVITGAGGWQESVEAIRNADPSYLDPFKGASAIGIISLLAWGLGYFGQPHILCRFMAAESVAAIPKARRIGMTWMILCLAGAMAVGFFGIAYFAEHPELAGPVVANHERVFIILAHLLFNPWSAGVLLAAILAAVMSTLSCQLLVCSSALTEDFYKPFFRKNASEKELVWVGRLTLLLVSFIAIGLAYNPDSRVLGLVSYAWAGFGSAFGPVVILALYWKRMTRNGALAGMVAGAVTVIAWKELAGSALYEMVPGVIAALLGIIVVSLLDKAPSANMLATHAAVDDDMHAAKS